MKQSLAFKVLGLTLASAGTAILLILLFNTISRF